MRPAESLHHLNTQDIGPKTLEAPTFDFDLAKMVSESDWQWVDDGLDGFRRGINLRSYALVLSQLMLFDPERARTFIRDEDWGAMQGQLDLDRQSRNTRHWSDFAEIASSMVRIDPVRTRGLFRDGDWAGLAALLRDIRTANIWDLANIIENLGTIDLEKTRQLVQPGDLDGIISQLRECHQSKTQSDRWHFMHMASIVTMFEPESVATEISADDWREMTKYFRNTKRDNILNFAATAVSLARLARVLQPLHDQPEMSTPMPEVKKY